MWKSRGHFQKWKNNLYSDQSIDIPSANVLNVLYFGTEGVIYFQVHPQGPYFILFYCFIYVLCMKMCFYFICRTHMLPLNTNLHCCNHALNYSKWPRTKAVPSVHNLYTERFLFSNCLECSVLILNLILSVDPNILGNISWLL